MVTGKLGKIRVVPMALRLLDYCNRCYYSCQRFSLVNEANGIIFLCIYPLTSFACSFKPEEFFLQGQL